ncbi:ABC transporter permease [Nitrococcus mobilis]|uniref:ABC transporter, inner membrane subunit n=1 Tax=Nitrococcus mobilis Nb-231 TaxID=314278 RepID=A4BQF5_9GAMM|nr:ABC transporter permease [Nitrococcus mobilis]EAR21805.1 ABC transporter, inner membrane subunit [Nitrococcus mobilis Nb-231]
MIKTSALGWVNRMQRLQGLLRKEFLQIVRDPSSIAIAFVMPMVLLLLFGYGVSLNARNVPVALVIDQPSGVAADFAGSFRQSEYLSVVQLPNMHVGKRALRAHRVDAVIHLRSQFAREVQAGRSAPIQVLLNGVDANTARIIRGYIEGSLSRWLQQRAERQGQQAARPVMLASRIWFNANVRSRNYLVPGLIAVIMTLIGAMLTALVVAREWERGTMEALMVTPVTIGEVLLGKLLPYFLLGMGGMATSVAMALWLFDVPLRGSVWVLFAVSAVFMLAALGMGLLISVSSRSQFVAGQAAIVSTFLPAFLLSGFIFDIHSMTGPIRLLTYLVPARYFVSFLQTGFLAGDVWPVIFVDVSALAIMAAILLGITLRRSRKRLD